MFLTFANKITICRILTVPFFILAVLYYTPEKDYLRYVALIIFLLAVLSDLADGYIARTHQQKSLSGAILDPLADKVLLISAFICLYKIGILLPKIRFPMWLVITVISRDIIVLIGSMIVYLIHGKITVEPTQWGKLATFFQVLTVMGLLLQIPYSVFFWYGTFCFVVISGIDYLRTGIHLINMTPQHRSGKS